MFRADALSLSHIVGVTVTGTVRPRLTAHLLCRPVGHEEALSAFTLKKLLLLVCFLDRAKLSRLIDHDPCLFCKDAEFKVRLPSCLWLHSPRGSGWPCPAFSLESEFLEERAGVGGRGVPPRPPSGSPPFEG